MLTCTAKSGHPLLPVALESIDLEICASLASSCRPFHSLLSLLAGALESGCTRWSDERVKRYNITLQCTRYSLLNITTYRCRTNVRRSSADAATTQAVQYGHVLFHLTAEQAMSIYVIRHSSHRSFVSLKT